MNKKTALTMNQTNQIHSTIRNLALLFICTCLFVGNAIPVDAAGSSASSNLQTIHSEFITGQRVADAQSNPPPFPCSFYGEINFLPTQPSPGTAITARITGKTGVIASTTVRLEGALLVYSIDVPADIPDTTYIEGGVNGDSVIFNVAGVDVSTGIWTSGTHIRLDLINVNPPPPLPSSFFGEIRIAPNPPAVGTSITVRIQGQAGIFASTTVRTNGTNLIYSVPVPGDFLNTLAVEGGKEGDTLIFNLGGVDIATSTWHAGVNTRLDFVRNSNPPPLPSGFYGSITFMPTGVTPGTLVEAMITGITGPAASTSVTLDGGTPVYAFDIIGDDPGTLAKDGGVEGDTITFLIGGRNVGTALWHAGTHTRLDFTAYSRLLQPGWNMVSINLIPLSSNISQVLSSISGNYDQVYVWDASKASQNWLFYSPNVPPFVNTLSALDEKTGFWIYITAPAPITLFLSGSTPTSTPINFYTTGGGWNLVSYPAGVTKPSSTATPAQVNLVYSYFTGDPSPWKIYDRNMPFGNTLTTLEPGRAYWMFTNSLFTWNVVYP